MACTSTASCTSTSSSSSSSPSSGSEYMPEPITLVYPPTSNSFLSEKPCRPFRVITPASSQLNLKRKRDPLDAGAGHMNQFRVVVRQPLVASSPGSSFGPTGKLKAKPPKAYSTSEELYAALTKTCVEDPEVDFSGSYIVPAPEADTVSDKVRVQMVTNDVWKATGYRFTVKDHPPTERGHKTRLWCSQDEARRSKHRGNNNDAPRVSKQGEFFAKQRFPCRSRLMITCLPSPESTRTPPGRIVTIRMHHYVRHEAYLESAAEASTSNGGVEAPGPPPPPTTALMPQTAQFLTAISAPLPSALMGMSARPVQEIELPRALPVAPPPPLHDQEGEWDTVSPSPSPSPSCFAPPLPLMDPRLEGLVHRPPPMPLPQSQSHSQQHISVQLPVHHSHSHPPPASHPPQPVHPQHSSLPSPPPPPQQQLQHQHHSHPHQHPHTHAPPPQQFPVPHPHPHAPPPPLQMQQQPQPQQQQPLHPPSHPHPHPSPSHLPPQPSQMPQQPPQMQQQHPQQHLTPSEFQHRMRTHIARIRDFCDGLEYQVQFNDYRMLEALERDAAPFIGLLEQCLRTEGRLG
ncbi:hypothetical protein C8R45DRAFT_1018187, partial [Mycena sanguinolenta]